MNLYNLLTW